MPKLSKLFNEFFYAWGDNDPKKKVWRYGKYITLERLHGYDDYKYYRPRRQIVATIILSIISLGIFWLISAIIKRIKGKLYKSKQIKKISSSK